MAAAPLTLSQCVNLALQDNPNLKVARTTLSRELLEVQKAKSRYWPVFDFSIDHYESTAPSVLATEVGAGANLITAKTFQYSAGITETLPTGTDVFSRFLTYRTDTTSSNALLSPYYYSRLEFGGSQKLLKGFDWFGTRLGDSWNELRVASRRRDVSEEELRNAVSETIRDIEHAYWTLVSQQEIVKARKQALEITQAQLEVTEKKIRSGLSVPSEIYQVQERLASRKGSLLASLRDLAVARNSLKTLIGRANRESESVRVNLAEELSFERFFGSRDEILLRIREENATLKALRQEIEAQRLEEARGRNLLLPSLDVEGAFFLEGGNSVSPADFGSAGSYSADLSELFEARSSGWRVSAKLEVPLGPGPDRVDYRRAKLEHKRSRYVLESEWSRIRQVTLETFEEIEIGKEMVATTANATQLAQKKLEFEQKRYESGLAPSFSVLQYQEDLTDATVNQITALLAYKKAVATIHALTGDLLKKFQIVIEKDEGEWALATTAQNP